MKIYAAADIHGKASRIAAVEKTVRELKPDLVVLAGDIAGFFSGKQTLARLGRLPSEVVAVKGNSDVFLSKADFSRSGILLLDLDAVERDGVRIAGVSGAAPLPLNTRVRLKERGMFEALSRIVVPGTVLVCHPPPCGMRDEVLSTFSAGSRLIGKVVESRRPRIVICGHIHERAGICESSGTTVVNCAFNKDCSGALVELEATGAARVRMLP